MTDESMPTIQMNPLSSHFQMFYANQPVEKPLPTAPIKSNDKALNSLLGLPMQRFYNAMEEGHESRRISINMSGDDVVQSNKIAVNQPKANALGMLMHHSIQKATWTEDPLRLCLVESTTPPHSPTQQLDEEHLEFQSMMPFSQQDTLPYTFKPKSALLHQLLMSKLYVVMGHNQWISPQVEEKKEQEEFNHEYLELAFELPFATAALIPPTPPPKEISTTPACPPPILLPVEAYSDIYEWDHHQDSVQPWLYTREEESYYAQSLMTSSPRASTSVYYFEDDQQQQQQQGVAEESWEAIFHPLSTFKHNKGELEYYAWNSVNLPVAAALVAQRVTNPTSHAMDDMHATTHSVSEATIPHIMPTPPLKPSPVLTIVSAEDEHELVKNSSELTLVNDAAAVSASGERLMEEGYYYDMLQKIRGSNTSSLDETRSTLQSTDVSVMDDKETHHQHMNKSNQTSFKRHVLAAALLLGKLNRSKSTTRATNTTNTTPTAMMDHHKYAMQDDKPMEVADPETLMMEKPRYWTEKRLFWTGFVCPLLWYYGSVHIKASSSTRLLDPSDLRWQKRCRLAALYFSIVLSVIILVTTVKAAGSAAIRQTQTDTIRAVIADSS